MSHSAVLHRQLGAIIGVLVVLGAVSAVSNSTNRLGILDSGATNVAAADGEDISAGAAGGEAAETGLDPAAAGGPEAPAVGSGPGVAGAPGAKPGAGPGAKAGVAAGAAVSPENPTNPAPSAAFTGPGVTATEIKIGITTVESGTVFGDVTGVPVDFGNTQAQAQAVVDHMNKSGGIAGRKVKPVFYKFDLTRAGLSDGQSEQEACSAWTEDQRVFAGVNTVLARQALLVCLAKRGVPAVHNGMPMDEHGLNTYRDFWYSTFGGAGMTLDRRAEKPVKVFAAQGLLGPHAVVGIEHFDDPAYKRVVDETFRPELAKVGVKKIVTQPAPRGGLEATSYVVNFQREGVTHVLFLGEGGLYPLFFMRAAEDQQYFPKYGLHTDQALAALLQPGAPPRQLANANAMGWTPVVDVDGAHDPGPVSDRNSLCLDIQKRAGQDMSNRAAMITALGYCDSLFVLQDALAPVPEITIAGLSTGFAALGSSYPSAGTFATRFSARKHDGVEAYRDIRFSRANDCNCFVYSSGTKPFPP